eukprot:gene1668-2873_t
MLPGVITAGILVGVTMVSGTDRMTVDQDLHVDGRAPSPLVVLFRFPGDCTSKACAVVWTLRIPTPILPAKLVRLAGVVTCSDCGGDCGLGCFVDESLASGYYHFGTCYDRPWTRIVPFYYPDVTWTFTFDILGIGSASPTTPQLTYAAGSRWGWCDGLQMVVEYTMS